MDYLNYIGKQLDVEIDRPLGSRHPEYGYKYPINYGYIPGTEAGDGEELDAYVIGLDRPVNRCSGVCIAVIHRKNDNEDKLVITADGSRIGVAEILRIVHFQEKYFDVEIFCAATRSK